MLLSETLFCYPSVILHPYHKLSWFTEKWHGYPKWLKTVGDEMKASVKECKGRLGDGLAVQRLEDEPQVASRWLAQEREKERAEMLAMGIDSSKDETSIFQAPLQAEAVCSTRAKHARVERELVHWNSLPREDIESPLEYWQELRNLGTQR